MNCAEKYYEWEKYNKAIGRMLFAIVDSLRPRGYYDEKYQYHEIPRHADEEDEYFVRAHLREMKEHWHEVSERKRNDGLVLNTH